MKTCFIVSIGILIVIGYGCGKSASADGPSKAVSAGNTTAVSHKMDEKKKEEHFIPATQGSKQQDELSEIESSLSQNHIDEATSLLINYYEKKKASKEDQSTTSANFIRLGDINWKRQWSRPRYFPALKIKQHK
ncbi:MAG: hypothetical protein HY717_19620 [Planctomycetes bacterium]|nr:hypothetical protein [Planctomycetota bacterium]